MYLTPKTLDEAVSLLASAGGQILAGGTDFYPALGDRLPPGRVVDITALGQIRGISTDQEWIRIGALTTWTDIIRTPLLGGNLKTAAWSAGLYGWGQAKA